ncbi:MAG: UPF0149 family protein [Gammaproteobacteria bacterium]
MNYQLINQIIAQSDEAFSAAEAHGMATGLLCINERTQSDRWLSELLINGIELNEEEKRLLDAFFEMTAKVLASDQFEFELFLPDEDAALMEKATALRNWCRGFLYGLGFAGGDSGWTGDASEIVRDISEITQMDTDVEGDEDEAALTEIIEYLRSAVSLLHEEFNPGTKRIVH